jgi:formate hydrogenlyase subunit 3/multisubunit Na+/H+ antiporter MnhD subunit
VTLFFCAGNLAEGLGIHDVRAMHGVGRRMPLTMGAFTLAALGMIGVPPIAGYVSKWYLGIGALQAGEPWCVLVLLTSSLLNAAYFLPLLHDAWFTEPRCVFAQPSGRSEIRLPLLVPPLTTALLALLAGLFAATEWSPLGWAKLIAARELRQ